MVHPIDAVILHVGMTVAISVVLRQVSQAEHSAQQLHLAQGVP
jgi:hypothetical protein